MFSVVYSTSRPSGELHEASLYASVLGVDHVHTPAGVYGDVLAVVNSNIDGDRCVADMARECKSLCALYGPGTPVLDRISNVSYGVRSRVQVRDDRYDVFHIPHAVMNVDERDLPQADSYSVVVSGWVWADKDLASIVHVLQALVARGWRCTWHTQMSPPQSLRDAVKGVTWDHIAYDELQYMQMLSAYEWIYLPRRPSEQVYEGRSHVVAAATGRPVITTRCMQTSEMPECTVIRVDGHEDAMAVMLSGRPNIDCGARDRYLDQCSVDSVIATCWEVSRGCMG